MLQSDEQFEDYLREFRPRRPRALPGASQTRIHPWRRLGAAAVITLAFAVCAWLSVKQRGVPSNDDIAKKVNYQPVQKATFAPVSTIAMTRLALDDPHRFDALLDDASREVLPDFRSDASTLRVLAKE